MAKRPNLIGFGSVAVDDLLFLPFFLRPDSNLQVEKHLRLGGGLAGTALVAAARLGAISAYFGVFGHNDLSDFTLEAFHAEGVQTHLCLHEADAKPLHSTILVDQSSGRRTILFSVDGFRSPPEGEISAEVFVECQMVFIDTFSLAIIDHVCSLAGSLQIPILADIEDTTILDHHDALNKIDHLILNIQMARDVTGKKEPAQVLEALETPMRTASVITAGAEGCWYKELHKPVYYMPAYPVDAIDTTGCGDVFHGAYAAAILRACNIPSAVKQASAAAAIKATRAGGRAGIPNLEKLEQFIAAHNHITPVETI